MSIKQYVFLLCAFFSSFSFSQNLPPIVLGISNAQSGPAAQLGIKLNEGAELYFEQVNNNGGIHGRKIQLIKLDDKYEPYNSVRNTHTLVNTKDIFALFNYVGTPTSYEVLPIVLNSEIPFLTPFTGAEFLRKKDLKWVYNIRASYYEESFFQVNYMVNQIKAKRIGLLVQADEFGRSVEQGYLEAMRYFNVSPSIITRYRRNTEDVELALELLKKSRVDAIAFVGTYQPLTKFITLATQQDFNPFYSSVSFVSSEDIAQRVQSKANLLVTQVVPNLSTCIYSICKAFVEASEVAKLNPNPISFEGYINAKYFELIALECGKELTRDCFVDKASSYQGDNIGGFPINFKESSHQGSHNIYHQLIERAQ